MKIFNDMVSRYVSTALSGHWLDTGLLPDDPSGHDPYVERARRTAELRGHLEYLRLGIEVLLTTPNKDLGVWMRSHAGHDDEEVRAGLQRMHERIWPNIPLPSSPPPDVELVPCPWPVWNITLPGILDPNAPTPDFSEYGQPPDDIDD